MHRRCWCGASRITRDELAAMNRFDRFPASHYRAAVRTAVLRGTTREQQPSRLWKFDMGPIRPDQSDVVSGLPATASSSVDSLGERRFTGKRRGEPGPCQRRQPVKHRSVPKQPTKICDTIITDPRGAVRLSVGRVCPHCAGYPLGARRRVVDGLPGTCVNDRARPMCQGEPGYARCARRWRTDGPKSSSAS
jgi:hypothetical protein